MFEVGIRRRAGLRRSLAWLVLLLGALPLAAGGFKPAARNGVPGVYTVILSKGVVRHSGATGSALPTVAQVSQALGQGFGAEVLEVWEDAVQGFVVRMPEARARELAKDPRVLVVEQDFGFQEGTSLLSAPVGDCYYGTQLSNTRILPSNTLSPQSGMICSDPDPQHDTNPAGTPPICQDNWGIDRIDQTSVARDGAYHFTNNGRNGATTVHVYVMDTGIRGTHREFLDAAGQSRVVGGANTVNNPVDDSPTADTSDCVGHGTHISGIMAGRTYGVAKDAILHPVKIFGCGGTSIPVYVTTVIRSLNWISGHVQRPAVINWSGGNVLDVIADQGLAATVQGIIDQNIVLVQAAGNQSGDYDPVQPQFLRDACDWSFGAQVPGVIVAGGSDENDGRWTRRPGDPGYSGFCGNPYSTSTIGDCGSNAGACIDVWAPAAHIVSSNRLGDDYYCRLSGTSMAAPHVVGVVALYLEDHPSATPAEVKKALRSRGTWNLMETSPSNPNWIGPGSDNVVLSSNTLTLGPDLAPVATYSVTCHGRTCSFDGTGSTDDFGIVYSYWVFGDGTGGGGPTAQHLYPANFSGRADLTVTDAAGHTDNFSRLVTVNADAPPTASFTVSCAGRTCTFNGGGSSDDQGIAGYAWSFGDGGTASGAVVSHTYASGSGFTATLTVTDTIGQTGQKQKSVPLDQPPTASFIYTCTGRACTFNGSGSSDDQGVTSYAWSFGDSSTASGVTASHTYVTSADFTVRLTVTDTAGQTGYLDRTVHIDLPPVAAVSVTCSSQYCQADGSASSDDRGPVTYQFDWTGGTSGFGSLATSTWRFDIPGTYTLVLTVKDNGNQTASVSKTFHVGGTTPVQTVGFAVPATQTRFSLRLYQVSGSGSPLGVVFKSPVDDPLAGDWDGDHIHTTGSYARSTSTFYLRNINDDGAANVTFSFGTAGAGWKPIAGDWNGDGVDTVGLYDPATGTFRLRNSNTTGGADVTFIFTGAASTWLPIAGDWDGDGVDTIGLYDPATSTFYLRNSNTTGAADVAFVFGAPGTGLLPIAGDWDGDGWDSIGVYNPATFAFSLKNMNMSGAADYQFTFGRAGAIPITGDWDGI